MHTQKTTRWNPDIDIIGTDISFVIVVCAVDSIGVAFCLHGGAKQFERPKFKSRVEDFQFHSLIVGGYVTKLAGPDRCNSARVTRKLINE